MDLFGDKMAQDQAVELVYEQLQQMATACGVPVEDIKTIFDRWVSEEPDAFKAAFDAAWEKRRRISRGEIREHQCVDGVLNCWCQDMGGSV